ncbi:MAG: hypothetical protein ACP6IQ_10725 [Candidatus Njordarchaeia archaeon]
MSLKKFIEKILRLPKKNIKKIIFGYKSKYQFIRALVISTVEGFLLSDKDSLENSYFVTPCIEKLTKSINLREINCRIIIPINEDNMICAYDYGIIVSMKYEEGTNIEYCKKVINKILDDLERLLL